MYILIGKFVLFIYFIFFGGGGGGGRGGIAVFSNCNEQSIDNFTCLSRARSLNHAYLINAYPLSLNTLISCIVPYDENVFRMRSSVRP